ncbi:MAG: hypothetical protein EXS18_02315 [Verrucomicrobiae bacterium]|nr:hypothetical protein [Verrucomicrobiae bacterium]
MPTLNWIGKEAVVNHHLHVPFHLLKDVPDLACGQPGDGNLIVQRTQWDRGHAGSGSHLIIHHFN